MSEGTRVKGSGSSKRGLRLLLGLLVVLVVVYAVLVQVTFRAPQPGSEITLDHLYRLADAGAVSQATLMDQDAVVVGQWCREGDGAAEPTSSERECAGRVEAFHAAYPGSDVATLQLIERLGAGGARVSVDPQSAKAVGRLLLAFVLPLVMLAILFGVILLSRGGDSSVAEIAGFGRLGRKRQREQAAGTGVGFADVAGQDQAVTELREVIDYLKDPAKFEAFGAMAPKGVLLFGPPGCGKTLLARAAAGESGVPFVSVSGTEFVESLVGVGAARVRDLFDQVRALAPAIVFIDEIDAVGRRREGEGVSGGEREQTLNQLLVEMDGFDTGSGVVLMAATNRPDILDVALLRPGRFDRQITLQAPDLDGRKAILAVHANGRALSDDVDFDHLARRTPGFTGADLASVMNEAVLLAIRSGAPDARITPAHLSEAIQRVLHGSHQGKLLTPAERQRLAVHESGHALVAAAVGRAEDVDRVSIVARGRGLGHATVRDGDRSLLTVQELQAQLAVAMGGLAAEELRCGGASTTAEDDVARANTLAREMVGLYGLGAGLDRMRILTRHGGYLGDATNVDHSVSEHTLKEFDTHTRRLLHHAEEHATAILTDHHDLLDRMVDHLQQHETLEGAALGEFLSTVRPTPANGQSKPRAKPRTRSPAAKKA